MSDVFLRSGPVRVQASFCGDAGGLAHLFCDLQRCFPQRRTIGNDRAGSKRELKRILLPIEVEHNLTSCHSGINLRKFFFDIIGWNCMNNVYCLGARDGSTNSKVPRCLDLDTVCARGRSRFPKRRKREASCLVSVLLQAGAGPQPEAEYEHQSLGETLHPINDCAAGFRGIHVGAGSSAIRPDFLIRSDRLERDATTSSARGKLRSAASAGFLHSNIVSIESKSLNPNGSGTNSGSGREHAETGTHCLKLHRNCHQRS